LTADSVLYLTPGTTRTLKAGPGGEYAYDVQSDGSLTNKRKFAMLHLTDAVLSAADPANRFDSRADGTAMDTDGRIYVATVMGVQIFDKTGVYVGTIWCPQYPVSVTFGVRTMTCSIWSARRKLGLSRPR
jgi:sugar lactone lactonase YvrE